MSQKMRKMIVFCGVVFLFYLSVNTAFCSSSTADYLCETGIAFYRSGRYDDALIEFKKALMLDPGNQTAKEYIGNIFKQNIPLPAVLPQPEARPKPKITVTAPLQMQEEFQKLQEKPNQPSREEIMNEALEGLSKEDGIKEEAMIAPEIEEPRAGPEPEIGRPAEKEAEALKITGEAQMSLGITPDNGVLWKRANADLNEKNFRITSRTAYDRLTNTYDTRVYDRVRVNLDTDNEEGLNFHSNITVDPWSFTGRSNKITVSGVGGDSAEIELKYWSNTRYTINETVFTLQNGDSFSLPEIKVKDDKIQAPITVTSAFTNTFNIPELKIKREFQPLRELWFDYKQEDSNFRVFPFAYQDQALTFDDPLRLSNNHIWWEESPWLDRWLPGRLNTGAAPDDFTRGRFDDALSFFTRDSDGTRLTALRGFSFELMPDERTYLANTLASPKGLWQDYSRVDNLINATRLKYRFLDNMNVGSVVTYRLGLNEDNKRDVSNYVWGVDSDYEVTQGLKLSLETALSGTKRDIASSDFETRLRGNAYNVSLIGTFPRKSLMDLKYGYSEIKPEKGDEFFTKYRLFFARMDHGFNPALSSYRETRDDAFWSRHIHFRKPFDYYYSGLYSPTLKWEDVEPYRIGNGIDIGRSVLGFRLENSLWDKKVENLFDLRNVHQANGKFVENVAREEVTYKVDDKLTTKAFGLYQRMPKTRGGVDPFIFDAKTGIHLNNAAIIDGKNPSLGTGSLGFEYAFTDWIALSGVLERTNDSTMAYDNFPRSVLNSSTFTTFREFDRVFRREDPFLFSQGLFPLPPYSFYNIYKTGLRFNPSERLGLYLDYTRNEFKSAGQIDENINHIGLEADYRLSDKMGFYLRYTFSRWNDLNRMTSGFDKVYLGHHNFFMEFKYLPAEDNELVMQYGESGRSPIAITGFDPFGGSISTLDTRHIIRLYYRRKF